MTTLWSSKNHTNMLERKNPTFHSKKAKGDGGRKRKICHLSPNRRIERREEKKAGKKKRRTCPRTDGTPGERPRGRMFMCGERPGLRKNGYRKPSLNGSLLMGSGKGRGKKARKKFRDRRATSVWGRKKAGKFLFWERRRGDRRGWDRAV